MRNVTNASRIAETTLQAIKADPAIAVKTFLKKLKFKIGLCSPFVYWFFVS